MLRKKSMTELRAIAQGYGVSDIFTMDTAQLVQAIEAKQKSMAPEFKVEIPKPEYDPRIMTKIPARVSEQGVIERLLEPYIARGLTLTFPEPETWAMSCGKRNDTGTMRMPPRIVLMCADKVLNG